MTQAYRYTPRTIAAGYARSALGLSVTIGPLSVLQPTPWLSAILIGGGVIFLVYTARSIAYHLTLVLLDETGIRTEGPFGARVRWEELRSMRLDYYTTRRDQTCGWMQLTIHGARGVIRIDSTLQGFAAILAAVARVSAQRQCPLDERTRTHLATLGIDFDGASGESAGSGASGPALQRVSGAGHA